jgi:hypothetical protein
MAAIGFVPLAVSFDLWAQADVIGRAEIFETLREARASCQRHFAPISTCRNKPFSLV